MKCAAVCAGLGLIAVFAVGCATPQTAAPQVSTASLTSAPILGESRLGPAQWDDGAAAEEEEAAPPVRTWGAGAAGEPVKSAP